MLVEVPTEFLMLYHAARRCKAYNTLPVRHASNLPSLPRIDQWKSLFPLMVPRGRVTLKSQESAHRLAHAFLPEIQSDSKAAGKTVIEAFPGT